MFCLLRGMSRFKVSRIDCHQASDEAGIDPRLTLPQSFRRMFFDPVQRFGGEPVCTYRICGVGYSGGARFDARIGGGGGAGSAEGSQVIYCALSVGGGLEYGARIVLQNFQPIGDVGGVLLALLGCQF